MRTLNLPNKTVDFYLTKLGQTEFGRIVSKKGSFRAVVLSSDGLGAWVLFPGLSQVPASGKVPVMLVKWEYVSTAVFEFEPEEPATKGGWGLFQPNEGIEPVWVSKS